MKRALLFCLLAFLAGCARTPPLDPSTGAPADSLPAAMPDSLALVATEDSTAAPVDSLVADEAPPPVVTVPPDRAEPPEIQEPEKREIYTFTGDDFQHRRQGNLRISTLTNAKMESDSLVITANRAERHENALMGSDEIFLYGEVVAVEGETRITGDKGHYDRWRDMATVTGRVRIVDPEAEITCQEAVYERRRQVLVLSGDVVILQDGDTISAQRILYHRDTGYVEAFIDVELHDPGSRTVMRGDHGSYDRELDVAEMDQDPHLTTVEGVGDTVRVRSRRMRQQRGDSLAIAVGNVHYTRGATEALCDSAVYFQGSDRLLLYGEPRLLENGSQLTGEVLELFFEDGELAAMNIEGSALFQDDMADPRVFPDRRSQISGARFHVTFEDGAIRDVEVEGNPRSVYIPPLGEDGRAAMNEVAGDSMLLRFEDGELGEVRIFGSSEGSYSYLDDWRAKLGAEDSLLAGMADSAAVGFAGRSAKINYKARDIIYDSLRERVYLEGEAEVESDDFVLAARAIRYDAREDILDARGEPVLIDKDDRLYGSLMEYDIDRGQGLIHEGATRYGDGYYTGERLKKVEDDLMHAQASTYTSCELADPHYHFEFDRMTIKVKDRMVGGPVRCYLGNVPVFYLPFIFSNLERGRRSGFLPPDFEFGITLKEDKPQRFIRDIGYYWAISDYADLAIQGDFVENRSIYSSLSYKYYRRYFMNGSVRSRLSYDVNRSLVDRSFSWGLRGSHNQSFGERSTLTASVDFVSSESLREIENFTIEETINQRLSSNVGFTRKWDNVSLNTSYSRTQILNQEDDDPDTDNLLLEESLPISLSTTSIPLWPGGRGQGGIGGALAQLKLKPRINYSRRMKTYETRKTVNESASTGSSLSYNFKLGFINLQPSVSASENWSKSSEPVDVTVSSPFGLADNPFGSTPGSPLGATENLGSEIRQVVEGGQFAHSWSASTSASTRFYGVFYPRLGRLSGLRHTISPSARWQYSENRGERFSLSRSLSFSLDNSLDLKLGEGEDVVRKTGIVNWSLNTGYDLTKKKEENPWSNLSSSLRFAPIGGLSMQIGHSYDLNRGKKLSTSISGGLNLSGVFGYGRVEKAKANQNVVRRREEGIIEEESRESEIPDDDEFRDGDFDPLQPMAQRRGGVPSNGAQNWNLGLNFRLDRTQNSNPSPSVNIGSRLSLTENWHLEYSTSLQLDTGELTRQTLNVTRDLHCWEATFSRLVLAGQEQYYFRIFLKAHPEDIKIESGDRNAGFGSY